MRRWNDAHIRSLLRICHPSLGATDIQTLHHLRADAWLVEDRNIPFVALEMRFKGGSAIDPADKSGATNLMMALLEEGSGEMDAQAFTTAKETLAANFSYDSYQDAVTVSARFLTENREEALSSCASR